MTEEDPAKTLADLLDEDGRPLEDIASRAAVGVSTLYVWRGGARTPKPWRALKLARALRVSRDRMFAALTETRRLYERRR